MVPVIKSMQPSWVKMRYRRHFATLSDRDNGGGNRTGTDAGLKQCILFRKITLRQPQVPEGAHRQIQRDASRDALKLDAGAQILTRVKANLGGRVDGGTREIVKNRPNRRCTSPSRNMRQHVRQRSAHLEWSNSMRPLPENHTRWPIRGFASIADKWSRIVTSRVFDRARARRARIFSPWDKANIAPPAESRRCPSSGNTCGTNQTRPGRSEILLRHVGTLSYGNF